MPREFVTLAAAEAANGGNRGSRISGVLSPCVVKMADRLLNRKSDLIRDQLESHFVSVDPKDPIYDSEKEVSWVYTEDH